MLRSLFFLSLGFLFVTFANPAQAEKRVALVIGISNYQQVPRLANPLRDAEAIGGLFKKAGFDVVDEKRDLGIADMRRVVREFSEKSRDADIAVVYYAGHGIEVDGTNYLVPADARLASDFDVEDETVSLDRLLKALDPVKRLRLVILDACRENPFSNSMKKNVASRSIGRGLARIEPAMSNTLVAFATKAGAVADDGTGENSQYATALVKYIAEPGVDLRVAFGRVRDEVLKRTLNRQEPFVYGSLGGDNLALVPAPVKPVEADADARVDYEFAAQLGTKEVWDSFIIRHPTGFYANLARAQMNRLVTAEQSQAMADNARRDAEEQAAQKAEKLQKRVEEPAKVAAAQQQQLEQSKKELEEARKQAELAQKRAEAARQEVEQAKRQAVEDAQRQIEEAKASAKGNTEKVAALAPSQDRSPIPSSPPQIGPADLARLLQAHLKRVGCNAGKVDGDWDESSQRALDLFNKNAKTTFDVKVASLDALDAVRNELDRVCPMSCPTGARPDGDRCIQAGCEAGYFLNSDGSCEKRRERDRERARDRERDREHVRERDRDRDREPVRRRERTVMGSRAPARVYIDTPRARVGIAPGTSSCVLDGSGHRETGGLRCKDF
jgi:multidrug efflux pump subunit AcrA (membrane-fusion protein)